jgi:hypothetical protein
MQIQIIKKNLTCNQHWKNSITYIITSNIEVLNNITIKIDDNTNILLLNNSLSSITFNEGSKLFAKKIISFAITSYDINSNKYIPATTQLNGGWNFMGNNNSKFIINDFKGAYLGSSTLSAITVTDINENKLRIDKIKLKSCTNNINLINSSIKIKKIKIYDGVNGFNLTNSFLNIKKNFNVSLITIGNLIYETLNTNILINKRAYFSLVAMNAEPVVQNVVFISNDQNVNGVNPPYNLTNINKLKDILNITID